MNFESKGDYIQLVYDGKIYSKEALFGAAYIMIDTAYIVLDGDDGRFLVNIRPKKKTDLKKLAERFNDELINAETYESQSRKNANLREHMLQRALLTNLQSDIEDPEEILVPWEEKYQK